MIKALLTGGGHGATFMFGITKENVERLQDGQPILVDLAEMGMPGARAVILYGETENELIDEVMQLTKGMTDSPEETT